MNDAEINRPLAQVLRAAATELAELAAISDHLELLAPSLGLVRDPALAERYQLADLLTQRLAGLTVLFDQLACGAPHDVALDIGAGLARLTLTAQARRFAGFAPAYEAASDPGDVLLFGD